LSSRLFQRDGDELSRIREPGGAALRTPNRFPMQFPQGSNLAIRGKNIFGSYPQAP